MNGLGEPGKAYRPLGPLCLARPWTWIETVAPSPDGTPVTKSSQKHLRIFQEKSSKSPTAQPACVGSLPGVLRAFQRTTGHSLRYVPVGGTSESTDTPWSIPVNPDTKTPPGHLALNPLDPLSRESQVAPPQTRELASAIGGMLGELLTAQHALWQREAELAAGVPLASHPDEQQHLAAQLQAVLQAGAQAVGCHAAALFLLDEATTELKLRSCWGLPADRLTAPARPLADALADLEAMLGHAVVLDDPTLLRHFNAPENFPAAACVPISSSTNILGTLWMFCNEQRDFTDQQTNVIELTAGRLASDLERTTLLREGIEGAQLKRQVAAAQRMQRNQLPTISPLLDGWDIAGWNAQAEAVGGDFFDWFGLPGGLLAVAVADCTGRGIPAALASSAVKAAVRAHGQYQRETDELLRQVNLTLWTSSAGDQFASMFFGLIETETGKIRFGSAGQPAIVKMGPDRWESLACSSPPLGESPEAEYEERTCTLQPGEVLVVFTDGFRDATDSAGKPLGESGVTEPLAGRLSLSARDLVTLVQRRLDERVQSPDLDDRTILVIKRTNP